MSLLKGIKWLVHWNWDRRVTVRARCQEENENMQRLKGMNLGKRDKHFSQTHFSYITLFSRINLAYIWKSYTCLKCYTKEQFVTLKYFMWKLREKDNAQYEKAFPFNLSVKENTVCAFFPQDSWRPQPFLLSFCLSYFTLPMSPIYFNSLFVSFFLCCFIFFSWKATFLFPIFLWHISKDSAIY